MVVEYRFYAAISPFKTHAPTHLTITRAIGTHLTSSVSGLRDVADFQQV